MKINVINEKIKRKYYRYLKEALGFSDATINTIERSILAYEDFTGQEGFGGFSQRKAIGFKKWLQEKCYQGKALSVTTIYHYLRHLKSFFGWLSGQPGFKSKIHFDSISYLSLEKKKTMEARATKQVKYPSLDYVIKLANSIEIKSVIDQRDRALICFLLLSGMRVRAVSTLPLGCFNKGTLTIDQDPKMGVETKFGKTIQTILFQFDDGLVKHLIDWAIYLEKIKLFSPADPLFPRSKIEQIENGLTFFSDKVEPAFWKGTGSIRDILKSRSSQAGLEYFNPHSYRHAASHLAMKNRYDIEEIKAISQNLGHEFLGTTILTYGKLDTERAIELVKGLDFSGKLQGSNRDETIELIKKQLEGLK